MLSGQINNSNKPYSLLLALPPLSILIFKTLKKYFQEQIDNSQKPYSSLLTLPLLSILNIYLNTEDVSPKIYYNENKIKCED